MVSERINPGHPCRRDRRVARPVAHGSGSEIFPGSDGPVSGRSQHWRARASTSLVRPIEKLCLLEESGRTSIVLVETLKHEHF